ncbi:MAG: hypothetical protein SWH68_00265 [Thermodesulfobacteriota bacterium]|nr:hypothetical protein [Thermodesulfobacteriota bacterium]
MKTTAVKDIKKRTLVYTISASVAVAVVVVVLILPAQYKIAGIHQEISTMQNVKNNQKVMFPVYSRLTKTETRLTGMLNSLQAPADAPSLPEGGIKAMPAAFKAIADQTGLILEACVPDLQSIEKKSPAFRLDLTLRGTFANLPRFLSVIESEPRIKGIKRLEIEAGPQITYRIGLMVAMPSPDNGKLET